MSTALSLAATVELPPQIEADRQAIEVALHVVTSSRSSRVATIARDSLTAGGKRLRPLLTCTVMRALGADPLRQMELIIASELVHTASLLHDDVVDGAAERRFHKTAHLRFDVPSAILAGDYLLSWALEKLAVAGIHDLQIILARTIMELTEGEILERERRGDVHATLAHVREVNRLKTAALFAYAAEAGVILANGSLLQRQAARMYGQSLGNAFQVIDDLLDWFGDPHATGKPRGQDLVQGLITIPTALACEKDAGFKQHVTSLLARDVTADGIVQVSAELERLGAFTATRTMARADTEQAVAALGVFPANVWRDQLASGAHAALHRMT